MAAGGTRSTDMKLGGDWVQQLRAPLHHLPAYSQLGLCASAHGRQAHGRRCFDLLPLPARLGRCALNDLLARFGWISCRHYYDRIPQHQLPVFLFVLSTKQQHMLTAENCASFHNAVRPNSTLGKQPADAAPAAPQVRCAVGYSG
jgi:hypothetical protein